MKKLPAAAFCILLMMAGTARAQYLEDTFLPERTNYQVLWGIPAFGSSAGMGHLDLVRRDSLKDPFVNPAKYYRQRGMFFIAPYGRISKFTHKYDFAFFEDSEFSQDTRFRSRDLQVPVGAVLRSLNFYFGAYAGLIDYYNELGVRETTQNDTTLTKDREGLRATPYKLLAGVNITPDITLGISYNRAIATYYENDHVSNDVQLSHRYDYLKMGLDAAHRGSRYVFLGSIYQNLHEMDRPQLRQKNRIQGLLLQAEYHRGLTSTLNLAARVTYDTRRDETTSENIPGIWIPLELGVTTAYQFSIGLEKVYEQLTLAAEADLQTSNFQHHRSSTKVYGDWVKLRAGADMPLSGSLDLTLGGTHTLYSRKSEIGFVGPSNGYRLLDPEQQSSVTELTAGLSWKGEVMQLDWTMAYGSYPITIEQNDQVNRTIQDSFYGQLTLQYLF